MPIVLSGNARRGNEEVGAVFLERLPAHRGRYHDRAFGDLAVRRGESSKQCVGERGGLLALHAQQSDGRPPQALWAWIATLRPCFLPE